jgi:hypothetical protein
MLAMCASPNAETDAPLASPEAAPAAPASQTAWWSRFRPEAGATSTCLDPTLVIESLFDVQLGSVGAIQVFSENDSVNPVHSVDLGQSAFSKVIAGREYQVTHPVIVDGATVRVEMGGGALRPHTTYFVAIDPGAFLDSKGNALPAVTSDDWSFSTGPAPAGDHLRVRADGTGDTCTVQGAIDAAATDVPVVIDVAAGNYHEILLVSGLAALTLRGQERDTTVVSYANNDAFQRGAGTVSRGLLTVENTPRFTIESLTLHNTTPEGGSQAEALVVQAGVRTVVRNARLVSTQDTVMMNGRAYLKESTLVGNVDYVWGTGAPAGAPATRRRRSDCDPFPGSSTAA